MRLGVMSLSAHVSIGSNVFVALLSGDRLFCGLIDFIMLFEFSFRMETSLVWHENCTLVV